MHFAAEYGHCGALQALAAAGAPVQALNSKEQTPLAVALSKVGADIGDAATVGFCCVRLLHDGLPAFHHLVPSWLEDSTFVR